MPLPILTEARRALWRSVDEWPALAGTFRRVWRFEDPCTIGPQFLPAMGELPALLIEPAERSPAEWIGSGTQRVVYTLDLSLWTAGPSLLEGERLWQEIVRAMLECAPEGQPPYVEQATGAGGLLLGPLGAVRRPLAGGGPVAICWRFSVGLPIAWHLPMNP